MIENYSHKNNYEYLELKNGTKIHKTAIVEPWVKFDNNCIIRPYAIVGRLPENSPALARQPNRNEELIIGSRTKIGCHAIIFSGSEIGNDCLIGDHSLIREGCRIGNQVMIGCHVSISYDCRIADRCRFQNSTVFHGECEEDCFFGVGVICSSDKRIDLKNYQHLGSRPPKFGKRVLIGSGANILPDITIGDDTVIAAGALVVKDISSQALVLGPVAKESIPHIWV